jgi:hypothetical protein
MRGKANGAQVAVKTAALGMNEHQGSRGSLPVVTEATQEVKLLQQLHHPNTVQLFGLAIKATLMDTKLVLVMGCCVRPAQRPPQRRTQWYSASRCSWVSPRYSPQHDVPALTWDHSSGPQTGHPPVVVGWQPLL